mgnify:CR=1 FL=1
MSSDIHQHALTELRRRFDRSRDSSDEEPGSIRREKSGRHDGEQVFPFYTLSMTAVAELFDEIPEIHLNTYPTTSVCFIGTIRRESAVVMIFTHPFPDDEHEFRIYGDGSSGLKSS